MNHRPSPAPAGRTIRTSELAALVAHGTQKGTTVLLGGSGSGKTHLLQSAQSAWQRLGHPVLLLSADAAPARFGTFEDLLRPLLRQGTPHHQISFRAVDELRRPASNAQLWQDCIEFGEFGGMVVVGNAHLLDEVTSDLLQRLGTQRVLPVVLSADPERLDVHLRAMTCDAAVRTIELTPLERSDVELLIDLAADAAGDLGVAEAMPDSLVEPPRRIDRDWVWQRCDGNPRLTVLLCAAAFAGTDGRGDLNNPREITDLVERRLSAATSGDRLLTELLAAVDHLHLAICLALLSVEALSRLDDAGLLTSTIDAHGRPTVSLASPLIRDYLNGRNSSLRAELPVRRALAVLVDSDNLDPHVRVDIARFEHRIGVFNHDELLAAARVALSELDVPLALNLSVAARTAGAPVEGRRIEMLARLLDGDRETGLAIAEDLVRRVCIDQTLADLDASHDCTAIAAHRVRAEAYWFGGLDAATAVAMEFALDEDLATRCHARANDPLERRNHLAVLDAELAVLAGDMFGGVAIAEPMINQRERGSAIDLALAVPLADAWNAIGAPERSMWLLDSALATFDPLNETVDPLHLLRWPFTYIEALFQQGLLPSLSEPDRWAVLAAHPAGAALRSDTFGPLARAAFAVAAGRVDEAAALYEQHQEQVDQCPHPIRALHHSLAASAFALGNEPGRAAELLGAFAEEPFAAFAHEGPSHTGALHFWVQRAHCFIAAAQGNTSEALSVSLALADRYRHLWFYRSVAVHDAVRLGGASLVDQHVSDIDRRVGATWFDRQVVGYARAALNRDGHDLFAIAERFEAGGLDLSAYTAVSMAARVTAGRPAQLAAQERASLIAQRCGPGAAPTDDALSQWLTAREVQVARLAAQGLTNKEIAARLGTSSRTVGNQLQSVYSKMGLSSRHDLHALW